MREKQRLSMHAQSADHVVGNAKKRLQQKQMQVIRTQRFQHRPPQSHYIAHSQPKHEENPLIDIGKGRREKSESSKKLV